MERALATALLGLWTLLPSSTPAWAPPSTRAGEVSSPAGYAWRGRVAFRLSENVLDVRDVLPWDWGQK